MMRLPAGLVAATLAAGCATVGHPWPTPRVTSAADDGGESLAPHAAAVESAAPKASPELPPPAPVRAVSPVVAEPVTRAVEPPVAAEPPIVEELTINVNE